MGFEHCKTLRWRLELWWTRSLTNETVLTAQQSETGPVILSVLLDPRQFFWSFAPSTNTIVLFNWINETQFFLDSSGRGICKKKCQFQLEHWRSVQVVKGALPGQNEKRLLLFDRKMSWSNNWASPQNNFWHWEKVLIRSTTSWLFAEVVLVLNETETIINWWKYNSCFFSKATVKRFYSWLCFCCKKIQLSSQDPRRSVMDDVLLCS